MTNRKKYVQVGLGGRHTMFRDAVCGTYADSAQMVAVCDSNAGRMALAQAQLLAQYNQEIPGYAAADFQRMIAETKPDTVIVTTMDATHDHYICQAMELGCDVITEKPMTTDAQKCQRIVDTQKRTGRICTVCFNYRYAPARTQIKDMLMNGVIGDVLSVDFHWMLNLHHGADYFRRWHRQKANSGGLMVHKSTHHFDLVNWWLSSVPQKVYASGQRRFYTPETADRYGLSQRGERCHGCAESKRCPFCLDLAGNDSQNQLYLQCEKYDNYYRDRCVFSADMDIEDCVNVAVDYANGTKMSYSLNAFCSWEGYTIVFNGTRGRLEHKCEESVYTNADGSVPGLLNREGTWTRVYPNWQPAYEVELWTGQGGHGGADPVMLGYIFAPNAQTPDPYLRAADQRSGAWSILTGIAANQSMQTSAAVKVDQLVAGLQMPDYPPMPSSADALPLTQAAESKA